MWTMSEWKISRTLDLARSPPPLLCGVWAAAMAAAGQSSLAACNGAADYNLARLRDVQMTRAEERASHSPADRLTHCTFRCLSVCLRPALTLSLSVRDGCSVVIQRALHPSHCMSIS